ncbi:hypothetical protein [Streptomyces sp. NPDC088707]|uniref:hypothetical protein n=1 Tax=Streptomyces sp. NPDC088707 TaxID=3365871 RepID=UPI003827ED68
MNPPDALCGAPGRDKEAGVDVTCARPSHGPTEQHRATYFGPFFKPRELKWSDPETATLLRIVAEYVTESNDIGSLDANDLVARLETAGFTLPELPEEVPA